MRANVVGLAQHLQQAGGHALSVGIGAHVVEQHHKFVATQSGCDLLRRVGHGVPGAQAALYAAGNLAQQLVAHVVAQGVVDLLKAVKVHKQQGKFVVWGLARPVNHHFHAVEQLHTVGQLGQHVGVGLAAQLLFEVFVHIDVVHNARHAQGLAFGVAGHHRAAEHAPHPAAAAVLQTRLPMQGAL